MKRAAQSLVLTLLTAGLLISCGGEAKKTDNMQIDNSLTQAEIDAGVFTPEIMWKMGRVGGAELSPDGNQVVYSLSLYSMEENKGASSIWMVAQSGGEPVKLTDNGGSDNSPTWSGDGKTVWFMSNRSGESQLWSLNPETKAIKQISEIKGGINSFGVTNDGARAYYTKNVAVTKRTSADIYSDLDKSKALIYDDLMVRHWDYWDRGEHSHIFVADIAGGKLTEGVDIMKDEPWDAPLAPYFDASEIKWNNAGTQLAYTCKKLVGKEYALSTNSDIYLYDLASESTRNMTEGMPGYEKYPVFSPDDQKLAFLSMATPGFESDKERLFVLDLASGDMNYLTRGFDYTASNVIWVGNDKLLFNSPIHATYQICRADFDGNVEILTEGDHDINAFTMAGDKVVCQLTKHTMATELFDVNLGSGALTQITNVNKEIYDNITMPEVQKRWVTTTDGKQMLTWVITPPNFDESKQYPTLLYCQGGPQSVVSQFWSYRWNFMLMASQGYVVVAPNRRGLPSFGQEWLEQISGDYSGQNIRDYLSAIDNVSKEPWVDSDRLGCVGASYGGYSAFYLAGNHDKRFKAFISHCGIFNLESMYGGTEELFFVNHDLGGSYWSDDAIAKRSYANSPHKFIKKWDSPILIFVGQNDFRIPYSQSLEAFTAAKLRGLDSRLVYFENEAHQVFQPQNSLTWNREFFAWLDKYVK